MASKKRTDKWIERTCQMCGKIFHVPPNQINHGRGKYCSPTCLGRAGGIAMRAKYPPRHSAANKEGAKRAYKTVNAAIQTGELQRGICAICGTNANICAHHKDYKEPFDIVWLCKTHHVQHHMGLIEISV